MIAATLVSALAAFAPAPLAAPPTCQPTTVTTRPGVAVALTTNCTDTGANPTVTITKAPIGGTLPTLPGTYTPAPGFSGVDEVRYTVTNATTGETSAQSSINLVVNSLPTCSNGTATTTVDTPLVLTFPCTDPDGGSVLVKAEHGQHGTVDPTVGTRITYTPDSGYAGTDEIRFVGMEGGFVTAERTLALTITPKPVATATPTPTATATPDATPTPPPPPIVVPTAVPTPPADKTAPSLIVKATGTPSVAKGASFSVTSNEGAVAQLTLAAGKHKASKAAVLSSDTTTVTLKLSAKARKALKAKKSVKSTLTVVATDAAGNRAAKKLSVTLKR